MCITDRSPTTQNLNCLDFELTQENNLIVQIDSTYTICYKCLIVTCRGMVI